MYEQLMAYLCFQVVEEFFWDAALHKALVQVH
jgi:hypothetical protein